LRPVSSDLEPSPFTVVIADDHDVVRDGVRTLLERSGGEFRVVAEAADVPSTLEHVRELHPDLLILDVSMPGGPSLSSLPSAFAAHADLKVVVLTMHEDPGYARQALDAGAHGYVLKEAEPAELMQAFRSAVIGTTYVHPRLEALLSEEPVEDVDPAVLDDRELEVVRLIARGRTNAQVAEMLHVPERSVKATRDRVGEKLGVGSRTELTAYARRVGLVEAPS
jgi:two-component system response regulator NreC